MTKHLLIVFLCAAPLAVHAADDARPIVAKYKAVFTEPPHKCPSDCSIDAPLLGNGDVLVAMGGGPAKLQFYVNKNDLWVMKREGGSHPCPLARLDLGMPDLEGASYHVEQDLLHAITNGRFQKGGLTLNVECGVSATENVLWIGLAAQGGTLRAHARLRLPGELPPAGVLQHEGGVQVVERRFEKDDMIPAGAACAVRVLGGDADFAVEPGKPVLIVTTTASIFDAKDFRAAAIHRAASLKSEDLVRMQRDHQQWWQRFWDKSFVEIPDELLEQRYYLSQYVLASASRVRDFPPSLFGWVTSDNPLWLGDYHLNYNHFAPFYGLYAANHIEQADPCHAPILAAAELGRKLCRKDLGIDGIYLHVGIGPQGTTGTPSALMQKSNSAYACVPLALRWYLTYDPRFGRQSYPFVRDTATFWENWLKFEVGRYVIHKDAIHECSGEDMNPLVSLALVRMVMDLALDMSKELDIDAGRRKKWMDIRDRMSKYPTCKVRDLPEQFRPKNVPQNADTLDLPIFRYTEKGTPWWADNTVGIQHVFPAGGVGLESPPELIERARNQIRIMNRWVDFNGMNSFYAAAARVAYDPNVILHEMHRMIATLGGPNGMIPENSHGMEHLSIVPNAIQEMLMQSHEGVIRLFPCWPMDQNARFADLRARGAFLVSAELKNGRIDGVLVTSERGRPCTVANPWPGRSVQVIRNGKPAETIGGERLTFPTEVQEAIHLQDGPVDCRQH
jgi:hypothetical protein